MVYERRMAKQNFKEFKMTLPIENWAPREDQRQVIVDPIVFEEVFYLD